MKSLLSLYRVLATVVGISIIVLVLVAVPLDQAHQVWPGVLPVGSSGQELGSGISKYLGTAHGFIYMGFLFVAFALSRVARWSILFTVVTLVCGTIPFLSFWAELRAVRKVQAQIERADVSGPVAA